MGVGVTTFALASLAASASAAMALWSWTGSRTSFLEFRTQNDLCVLCVDFKFTFQLFQL